MVKDLEKQNSFDLYDSILFTKCVSIYRPHAVVLAGNMCCALCNLQSETIHDVIDLKKKMKPTLIGVGCLFLFN